MVVDAPKIWNRPQTRYIRAKYYVDIMKSCFKNRAPSCDLLLDVGSASGELTKHLMGFLNPSDVLCVDKRVNGLKVAHKATHEYSALSLVRADAQDLPVREDAVDVVTAFSVIEYLVHQERFTKEVNRVLKDRGFIILQFANPYSAIEPYTGIPFSFLLFKSMRDAIVRKRLKRAGASIRNPSARYVEKCLSPRYTLVAKEKLVYPEEAIPPELRPFYRAFKAFLAPAFPSGYLFIAQKTLRNTNHRDRMSAHL